MYHRVDRILTKPDDYKICRACGNINWYENDVCKELGCSSTKFKPLGKRFLKNLDQEYDGYDIEIEV